MMDTLLNLLFRCQHRSLTRPMGAARRGGPACALYVVCLDCGKQFAYDWNEMRVGAPMDASAAGLPVPGSRVELHR
jgi:hypothetical protein